jgi:hypothetical protein
MGAQNTLFRVRPDQNAGGGGSGGAILLEATSISLAGVLAANGGGGGGDSFLFRGRPTLISELSYFRAAICRNHPKIVPARLCATLGIAEHSGEGRLC